MGFAMRTRQFNGACIWHVGRWIQAERNRVPSQATHDAANPITGQKRDSALNALTDDTTPARAIAGGAAAAQVARQPNSATDRPEPIRLLCQWEDGV